MTKVERLFSTAGIKFDDNLESLNPVHWGKNVSEIQSEIFGAKKLFIKFGHVKLLLHDFELNLNEFSLKQFFNIERLLQ